MFEKGKIGREASEPADGAAILRELRWSELVGQLAATRELREEAGRKPDELQTIGRFRSFSTCASAASPQSAEAGEGDAGGASADDGADRPGERDAS